MVKEVLSPIDENGGPSKDIKSLAICDPGGASKTQFANEFVHPHTNLYEAII
ncbi:hypothetical protein ANO14919_113900 [Xylariales sp. No.14919]|nr:hypothetical protein ANO14919_113900 [Xylariales sp. No.14919]